MNKKWNFRNTNPKAQPNRPYILIQYHEAYGCGHIVGMVLHTEDLGNRGLCPVGYSDYIDYDGHDSEVLFYNLQITSQRDIEGDMLEITQKNRLYCYDLEYTNERIRNGVSDLEKTSMKLAFMRKFNVNMQKMGEKLGPPREFATWLIYASNCLGVEIATRDPNGIHFIRPADVAYAVDNMLLKRGRA